MEVPALDCGTECFCFVGRGGEEWTSTSAEQYYESWVLENRALVALQVAALQPQVVADVGAASGPLLPALLEALPPSTQVIAVDPERANIALGMQRHPEVTWRRQCACAFLRSPLAASVHVFVFSHAPMPQRRDIQLGVLSLAVQAAQVRGVVMDTPDIYHPHFEQWGWAATADESLLISGYYSEVRQLWTAPDTRRVFTFQPQHG